MCTSPMYVVTDFQTCDSTGRPVRTRISYASFNRKKTSFLPPRFSVKKTPCQDCIECRKSKAKEWTDRGVVELEEWEKATMITLTYDDENVHKVKYIKNDGQEDETLTLRLIDHQNFMKDLRDMIYDETGEKIKFMMCGEYGSAQEYEDANGQKRVGTERPHYHYIIFGHDFDDKKFYKWSYNEWSKIKNPLFKSEKLNKLWKKGHADINEVTPESIGYVCGYVTKKLKGEMAKTEYEDKNREAPFFLTSKGIGKKYFEKNKERFYEKKKLYKKTKKGLETIKLSRYYLKLIEKEDEKKAREIKRECEKKGNLKMDELLLKTSLSEAEYIAQSHYLSEKRYGNMKRGTL
ncbi:replication initiation protein [Alces alces faeces associated microvirus MP12 5423]|uniref:replication initiation protein n=1 Tax=Alces alces faeces associated microvirus MP12 5423 TaxID=2219135 RepID=UPI000DF09E18|nr:replication initiation protein [Alces alces faeces associated microvirus MP12 5423]AXB22578.1 replication initiation protein [Alces alces faeces associated microvirus MP12 5423]